MQATILSEIVIRKALERNGYNKQPTFLLLGVIQNSRKLSVLAKLGSGVVAVAIFEGFIVHVFGRIGPETGASKLGSEQLVVREVALSGISSVSINSQENLGAVVTLHVADKGGMLQQVLSGGDIVIALNREQLEAQRDELDKLRQMFA